MVKIHLGGNKFELNLLKPENINQGTFLMKLQHGLETIFKLHFKIQVCFCTELITRVAIYGSPGPTNGSSECQILKIIKMQFSLVLLV